ncbi:TlpA family protein disulfide reductase [Planctomycetota bacterium]
MKNLNRLILVFLISSTVVSAVDIQQLRREGLYGFPQQQATALCDSEYLRFSVYSNDTHLFAQAMLWQDGDDSQGTSSRGEQIGDWSKLLLDLDGDSEPSPRIDRGYSLNPWPDRPGLYYQIQLSKRGTSRLMEDSAGRGCINYLNLPQQQPIRVDSYVIPLAELSKKSGDAIRLCYWASSPKPAFKLDSLQYLRAHGEGYSYKIPRSNYHHYTLQTAEEIDIEKFPAGRKVKPKNSRQDSRAVVGQPFPTLSFKTLTGDELSVTDLVGRVVLIDFWATWCGPCRYEIPGLVSLYKEQHDNGFEIIGISLDSDKARLGTYLAENKITWPQYFDGQGWDNAIARRFGVRGIPSTFLIDRSGVLRYTKLRGETLTKAVKELLEER